MSIPDTSITAQMVKNLPAVRENQVQSLGLEDTLEKGILPFSSGYYALQYSCLDDSKDKGAWWATVHAVTESEMAGQLTHERLLLNEKMPGFLASGGEFNPGPETRLDLSELLCNKVLLKYKGDRESF